eukprot:SAG31_NODE_1918_length_6921_cov_2.015245_10_plen_68_part_00
MSPRNSNHADGNADDKSGDVQYEDVATQAGESLSAQLDAIRNDNKCLKDELAEVKKMLVKISDARTS